MNLGAQKLKNPLPASVSRNPIHPDVYLETASHICSVLRVLRCSLSSRRLQLLRQMVKCGALHPSGARDAGAPARAADLYYFNLCMLF